MPVNKRGKTNGDFVLNVDLAPTILGAAGIAAPPRMQGQDFAALYLAKQHPAWRNEFYYEHAIVLSKERIPASEAVVRHKAKYIYWPDYGVEEFFDLAQDPLEEHDLSKNAARAKEIAVLRERLKFWREQVK